MGSGTALGEALKLGARAIGCDINPVSTFIVRQALTAVEEAKLRRAFAVLEPTIVRHGVKIIYGFGFRRDDPEWDTDTLRLPSAYVGIWESNPDGLRKLPCPAGWKEPPQSWLEKYVWACEISELRLREGSLSASYLDFFNGAFTALKAVL